MIIIVLLDTIHKNFGNPFSMEGSEREVQFD